MRTKRSCIREYKRIVNCVHLSESMQRQFAEECLRRLSGSDTPRLRPVLAAFAAVSAAALAIPGILHFTGKL